MHTVVHTTGACETKSLQGLRDFAASTKMVFGIPIVDSSGLSLATLRASVK